MHVTLYIRPGQLNSIVISKLTRNHSTRLADYFLLFLTLLAGLVLAGRVICYLLVTEEI